MVYLVSWFVILQSFFGFTPNGEEQKAVTENDTKIEVVEKKAVDAAGLYQALKDNNEEALPSFDVFNYAYNGYQKIRNEQEINDNLLTVIDFSLASTEKRMWVIDLSKKDIVFHNLVAHGQGSGNNMATEFSNVPESHKSSIGFYLTNELYTGKHGLSMRLDGLEKGFNDKARERAIVVHGADYATENFVKSHGRLGRSHGCPAVPSEITEDLVKTISKKSVMFLYYPDYFYIKQSAFLNYADATAPQTANNNS